MRQSNSNVFYHSFRPQNAKAFAHRIQQELNVARGNIYNQLREATGLPYGDISDIRLVVMSCNESNPRLRDMLQFADNLFHAEAALIKAELELAGRLKVIL